MNEEVRDKIVELALEQLGKEYVHGKNGSDTFDCAGLVYYVYKRVMGINLYEDGIGLSTTGKIMTNGKGNIVTFDEKSIDKDIDFIKKGDILFLHRQALKEYETTEYNKYPGHCAIYLGNRKFIHATRLSGTVVINDLDDIIDPTKRKPKKWKKILVGYKNMID